MPDTDRSLADIQHEATVIRRQFQGAAVAAITVLGIGTVFYHQVEHLKWLDSVYFCTITLTTIGYGDIVPTTNAGKLFTIFYVLIGIGILAFFANVIIKNAVVRRELRRSSRTSKS